MTFFDLEPSASRECLCSGEYGGAGGGLGLTLGYGFGPLVTTYVRLSGGVVGLGGGTATDDDYNSFAEDVVAARALELGARFHFRRGQRLRPYAAVAVSARTLSYDDISIGTDEGDERGRRGDLTLAGRGLAFGGGLLYALTPSLALDAGFHFTGARYGDAELDGQPLRTLDEVETEGWRLQAGAVFYPLR